MVAILAQVGVLTRPGSHPFIKGLHASLGVVEVKLQVHNRDATFQPTMKKYLSFCLVGGGV